MQLRTRTLLRLAAATALTFSLMTTTASASRLRINERTVFISWVGLEFSEPSGSPPVINCPVTLAVSLTEAVITKTPRGRIGSVVRASVDEASCSREGSVKILERSLPWTVMYEGFSGTLPLILSILLVVPSVSMQATIGAVVCLYRATETRPFRGTLELANGRALVFRASEASFIPLFEGFFLCPSQARVRGPANVNASFGEITLRLI